MRSLPSDNDEVNLETEWSFDDNRRASARGWQIIDGVPTVVCASLALKLGCGRISDGDHLIFLERDHRTGKRVNNPLVDMIHEQARAGDPLAQKAYVVLLRKRMTRDSKPEGS